MAFASITPADSQLVSADGWTFRPEQGPESYRVHAEQLYRTLGALDLADRAELADREGGRICPCACDDLAVTVLVVLGEKTSALLLGPTYPSSEPARTAAATAPPPFKLRTPNRDICVFSASSSCLEMLTEALQLPFRSAWRHVLSGVALGYSDADITRFCTDPRLEFEPSAPVPFAVVA